MHHAESVIGMLQGTLEASEKDYQDSTFEEGRKKQLENKIRMGLKDVASMTEQLSEIDSVIEEAKKAIRKADKESQILASKVASIRGRIRSAYANLAKLAEESEAAEKKFKEAEAKLQEEDKKLQKMEEATAKLQDSLAEYESLPDDASRSDITAKQDCLNNKRKDLLKEIEALTQAAESVQRQGECTKKAEEELNRAKKKSQKEMNLIEEKEEECDKLVQSSKSYSSESAKARRKLEKATEEDSCLKLQLEDAVDGVNEHVNGLHGYFEQLITRLNTLIKNTMDTIKFIKAKMEDMARVEFDKMGMRLQ